MDRDVKQTRYFLGHPFAFYFMVNMFWVTLETDDET
jgi:hypothetical protein